MINKSYYIHKGRIIAAKKDKNKEDYELIWSDFQDIWLRENSKMQKSTYRILSFMLEKKKGKKIHIWRINQKLIKLATYKGWKQNGRKEEKEHNKMGKRKLKYILYNSDF